MENAHDLLILIVDDNSNNLQVLGNMLSARGFKIALASNGQEALDFVEKQLPDLIFLDIMMPDINGFEVCKRLKSNEKFKDIPVLFISALSNPANKIKGFEAGGVDYISKPFSMAEVIARAKVHLNLKTSREECTRVNKVLIEEIKKKDKLEEELKQAKEIAEASTRLKNEFLFNMSHEIHTPMNGIIGTLDILKKTNLDKIQKDYVDIIDYSANNLLTIINDILNIAKAEIGHIILESIDFNIHNIVYETVKLLKPKTIEKGIEITSLINDSVPLYAKGDPIRLKQIVINLANSAIKLASQGSVKIEAELIEEGEKQRKYLFKVNISDTAIPENIKDDIFMDYSQTDISRSGDHDSNDFGLSITKNLVKLMGGEIGFESDINKGTTFWFTIILEIGKEPPYDIDNEESDTFTNGTKRLSILIAEDNFINQKVAIAILKQIGHKIEVADNGKIAVTMHKKNKFDIILMDIQMPVMDGFEATKLIREFEQELPDEEKVKIIALTANAMKEDRQKCLDAEMDEYISKPFKLNEIVKILDII